MMMSEPLQFQGLRGQLRRDEAMARHVSWRAGGPADRFYIPADLDDLSAFLGQLPEGEPLLFVGLGSNLLVRDKGWRGTVILTHCASRRPAMDGKVSHRGRDEFDIGYRHCVPTPLRKEWFAAAWFRFKPGDGDTSRGIMKELLARRIATQPLSLPNAGSVFRNPPRDHAARLIEACGLKGFARGGARVSEKHANFIVNPDGAGSAADIEGLIQHIQRMVYQMKGVVLSTEVRIVGEPA